MLRFRDYYLNRNLKFYSGDDIYTIYDEIRNEDYWKDNKKAEQLYCEIISGGGGLISETAVTFGSCYQQHISRIPPPANEYDPYKAITLRIKCSLEDKLKVELYTDCVGGVCSITPIRNFEWRITMADNLYGPRNRYRFETSFLFAAYFKTYLYEEERTIVITNHPFQGGFRVSFHFMSFPVFYTMRESADTEHARAKVRFAEWCEQRNKHHTLGETITTVYEIIKKLVWFEGIRRNTGEPLGNFIMLKQEAFDVLRYLENLSAHKIYTPIDLDAF